MNNNQLLQLEIYLLEFIDLCCIKDSKEIYLISEFKHKFQNYTGIDYSSADVTISKVMINKLKYSSIIKNGSRYFQGLLLKD